MEYLVIAILSMMIVIIMYKIMNVKIKQLKEIGENTRLNEVTNRFPENIEIGKAMLKNLNNEMVKIEESKDEKNKTSLYIIFSNTISIANIRSSYTRIQTIAHECVHSIQDKRLLWMNFVLSNISMVFYFLIVLFTLLKVITQSTLPITILSILLFTQYMVRSYLETDAMIKARYVAKEYIEQTKLLTNAEEKELVDQYDHINTIGIKMYNFLLFAKAIFKIVLYAVIVSVMGMI